MRLAHLRRADGARLAAETPDGWVDVAAASGDDRLRTLSGLLAGGEPALRIAEAATRDAPGASRTIGDVELASALDRPGRIFCIGRNYVEHRDEFKNQESPWPESFIRLGTTVTGPYDDIPRPSVTEAFDYEGELGVVIGRPGRHIPRERALDHVFGFTVTNDFSARDWQKRGLQWTAGKNFDGTLPVGPAIVTADAIDATDLLLETRVNGTVVQSARTSQFIFDLGVQIEYLSSFTALQTGDLICTGTPGGVGAARTPPLLLTDGDVVEVEIEGLGAIRNRVVDDRLDPARPYWRDVANRRAGESGSA